MEIEDFKGNEVIEQSKSINFTPNIKSPIKKTKTKVELKCLYFCQLQRS